MERHRILRVNCKWQHRATLEYVNTIQSRSRLFVGSLISARGLLALVWQRRANAPRDNETAGFWGLGHWGFGLLGQLSHLAWNRKVGCLPWRRAP
jgi:hypothetical protein